VAKHQATMKIEHGELTLRKRSAVVNFELRADGQKLGELEISGASVTFKRFNRIVGRWRFSRFIKMLEDNV
jgi:hypothetical protein